MPAGVVGGPLAPAVAAAAAAAAAGGARETDDFAVDVDCCWSRWARGVARQHRRRLGRTSGRHSRVIMPLQTAWNGVRPLRARWVFKPAS